MNMLLRKRIMRQVNSKGIRRAACPGKRTGRPFSLIHADPVPPPLYSEAELEELAAKALIPQFVSLCHELAERGVQPVSQPHQCSESRIAGATNQRVQLLGIQVSAGGHHVLVQALFNHPKLNRFAECCMVLAKRWGFSFRGHEQQFYSSPDRNDRAHMGYHGRRQSSAPQFGRFSIIRTPQEQDSLRVLGEAFAQLRTEQGRTVADLAAATGVPAERIQSLEAGTLDPDLDSLLALTEGIGLRPSDLILRMESLTKEGGNEN